MLHRPFSVCTLPVQTTRILPSTDESILKQDGQVKVNTNANGSTMHPVALASRVYARFDGRPTTADNAEDVLQTSDPFVLGATSRMANAFEAPTQPTAVETQKAHRAAQASLHVCPCCSFTHSTHANIHA